MSQGPHYILDEKKLNLNLLRWKSLSPNLNIAYSLKANYNPKILDIINTHLDYLEVCSEMEMDIALKYGKRILLNGPSSSNSLLKKALENDVFIICDSLSQVKALGQLSSKKIAIGLRIRFDDFPITRFGMTTEEALQVDQEMFEVKQLHCHYCEGFRQPGDYQERILSLESLAKRHFPNCKELNIGGGFYSEMPEDLSAQFDFQIPSFLDYQNELSFLDEYQYFAEIGNALVADVVSYKCQVSKVEQRGDSTYVTTNGSKWDIQPNGSKRYLPVEVLSNESTSHAKVFGYTCMENDVLFEGDLPLLKEGDWIVFRNCGAYAESLAPNFIQSKKQMF